VNKYDQRVECLASKVTSDKLKSFAKCRVAATLIEVCNVLKNRTIRWLHKMGAFSITLATVLTFMLFALLKHREIYLVVQRQKWSVE